MTNWVKTSERLPPKGHRTMIIYNDGDLDNLGLLPATYDEGLYDLEASFQCRVKKEFRKNIAYWLEYENSFWTESEKELPKKEGIYGVTTKVDLSQSPLGIAMGFGRFLENKKWTSIKNNVPKNVIFWLELPDEIIKILEAPKDE